MPRFGSGALALFICCCGLSMATACSSYIATEQFTITIDSIVAPASVRSSDTIVAKFYGVIGTTGCSYLKRVEIQRQPNQLGLRFVGERRRSGDCTLMPVFLEHEEKVPAPPVGEFTISVFQPSGEPLVKRVQVQ